MIIKFLLGIAVEPVENPTTERLRKAFLSSRIGRWIRKDDGVISFLIRESLAGSSNFYKWMMVVLVVALLIAIFIFIKPGM